MIGWRPAAFGLLLALLCWLGLTPDAAAKRIALVVGNAAYQNLSPLRNTSNDAAAMAASLRQVGFEVTTLLDADLRSMKRAFLEFGRAMRGEVEATFIFYAGHGVQVGGENFLMPVDANVRSEDEVALEGINANDFLQVLNGSRGSVNIVVLDACRNNPFPAGFRSTAAGLAPVLAPRGTFIGYSTAPGAVASDGAGSNSDYTAALAETIRLPGLEIAQVFRKVRERVLKVTGDQQTPWESSSIIGEFYFTPPTMAASPTDAAMAPYLEAAAQWKELERSSDVAGLEAFATLYGDSLFGAAARARLTELRGREFTPMISPLNDQTPKDFAALPEKHPRNELQTDAGANDETASGALNAARSINSARGWQLFLFNYGLEGRNAELAAEAMRKLDATSAQAFPAGIERSLGLSADTRATIQSQLASLGFDVQSVDGSLGPRTRAAIAAYQRSVGLPSTGYVDFGLLRKIGVRVPDPTLGDFRSDAVARRYDFALLKALKENEGIVETLRCIGLRRVIYGQFQGRLYVAVGGGAGNATMVRELMSRCKSHLVSISSKEENSFIYNLIADDPTFWRYSVYGDMNNKIGPLLGLSQARGSREPRGGWAWTSGEPAIFFTTGIEGNQTTSTTMKSIFNSLRRNPDREELRSLELIAGTIYLLNSVTSSWSATCALILQVVSRHSSSTLFGNLAHLAAGQNPACIL